MYLEKAILKLRPSSEFRIENNDYATIEWFVLEGKAPSQSEINETIEQIKADEAQSLIDKATAKAALLERLGLTENESKLLLS
jgi:hypothetical protein